MSMQRGKWSISALSVELGLDRRTIAKRLEGLRPVSIENGVKYYRLDEAIKRLKIGPGKQEDNEHVTRFKDFIFEFVPEFYGELAPKLTIIVKDRSGLPSSEVFRIFEEGFAAVYGVLGKALNEDPLNLKMKYPSFLAELQDPQRRKSLCEWLDKEAATYKEAGSQKG